MKKETLELVLQIMEEEGRQDTGDLLQAAGKAEEVAAISMGTSGTPDWLAPCTVVSIKAILEQESLLQAPTSKPHMTEAVQRLFGPKPTRSV